MRSGVFDTTTEHHRIAALQLFRAYRLRRGDERSDHNHLPAVDDALRKSKTQDEANKSQPPLAYLQLMMRKSMSFPVSPTFSSTLPTTSKITISASVLAASTDLKQQTNKKAHTPECGNEPNRLQATRQMHI